MDVVGVIGYSGQPLAFVSPDKFAFVSGNGLCMIDCHLGPREILWRIESGISTFVVHEGTNRLAIASTVDGEDVEIIHYPNQTSLFKLANPTTGKVISLSFSRDGSRLLGISDVTDHKVFVWDVSSEAILFVANLPSTVKLCAMNPADSSLFVVYGDSGLLVGNINEVMGEFSVKLENLQIEPESIGEIVDEEDVNQAVLALSQSNSICFTCWAPSNRVFIGNCQGFVIEVDVVGRVTKPFFRVPQSQSPGNKQITVPTCAVLSTSHLIVGSSNGMVYWYSMEKFPLTQANGAIKSDIDLQNVNDKDDGIQPSQIVKLHRNGSAITNLNSLLTDSSYTELVAGSASGLIYQMSVELQVVPPVEGAEDDGLDDDVIREVKTLEMSLEPVYDMHEGAVLCVRALALPVSPSKGSPPQKGTDLMSVYITASHLGIVTFWRPPAVEVENMTGAVMGIRRSVPRVLHVLGRGRIGTNGQVSDEKTPAATVIERFPVAGKLGSRIFGVGTSDGWLEVWQVRAYMVEEDEDGGEEEDGGVLKLEVLTLARRHVFRCPVTMISAHESKPCVAIGASGDDRVYIMSTTRAAKFQIVSYVSIGNSATQPTFCVWSGILLWVGCQNGKMYTFQPHLEKSFENANPEEAVPAKVVWDTMYSSIGNAFLSSAGGLVTFSPDSLKLSILPSLPSMMELEQANLLHGEGDQSSGQVPSLELPGSPLESPEHEDFVICTTRSPNGGFVASGTANGSVYIWRIRRTETTLMNRLCLHAGPVIVVSFNAESSQVMSCGADGSVYITNTEKGAPLRNDPMAAATVFDEEELKKLALNEERIMSSGQSDKLWVEQKQAEAMDSLHDEYRGKSSELRSSVQDLCARLGVLLQRNEVAQELEKMDRAEFVVDLKGKEELLQKIDNQEQSLRQEFESKNYKNELIAARIRSICWDIMETHSRRLLTLQPEVSGQVYLPSYAVKRYTERQLRDLDRVCRLRATEMKAQRFHGGGTVNRTANAAYRVGWTTSLQGCPNTTSWVVNDALHWPCADVVDALLRKERQDTEIPKLSDKKEANVSAPSEGADDDDDTSTGSLDLFEQEFDERNVFNLLYPPVAIRTQIQKRTQIVLLNEVVRLIKIKFNEHFEKLASEKEDVIASIESRNARINEILSELHIQESYFQPKWDDVEIAGSSIVVSDSEVSCRPYETEMARAIRLAEEQERKLRAAEKDKENVKALALDEMMYGTLEVKRDVFAEASALKKPVWMTEMRLEDMSEVQRKEVDDFEAKYKVLQEEQVKYRKSLELELKRLKGEVQDISKAFDEKLLSMARLRMLVQKEILSQELIMARLSVTMVKREQLWASLKSTEQSIDEMRRLRNEVRSKIDKFSGQVEEEKQRLLTLQEEEKSMDRTFKRDLQTLCTGISFDQENLKVFTQLYRMRQYADEDLLENDGDAGDDTMSASGRHNRSSKMASSGGKKKRGSLRRSSQANTHSQGSRMSKSRMKASSGMGSKQSTGMGPLQQAAQALKNTDESVQNLRDPFYATIVNQEKAKKIADSQIPLLLPLSLEADCPEGFSVDQFTWSKLQELRTARIQKEIAVKRLSQLYGDLKKKFDQLTAGEDALVQQIDTLKANREATLHRLSELERNIEIVVAVRQGQEEVDRDAVVADYSDALLLPTEVVNKYNSRIYELGKDKTGVLSRMKQFRRKINLVDWEARHLRLQSYHLEEYFTDLQLLRITRELQQVIRDGTDADQSKSRLEKSTNRKEFLIKDSENKLTKLQRTVDGLRRQLEDRRMENESLDEQIHGLKREVAARESVRQSRNDARGTVGDPAQTAMTRMKRVVVRRQLVDLARTQAEEIDFLRQELDRMRQKTFPSFVRAARSRLSINADER
eukprot:gene2914-5721_t